MPKQKPPVDIPALEGLLARARASIGQLITDGEVDEAHLRRIFRMLEGAVLEGEETVEDIAASKAALQEYKISGGVPFDDGASPSVKTPLSA